jgi:hypothetical protein
VEGAEVLRVANGVLKVSDVWVEVKLIVDMEESVVGAKVGLEVDELFVDMETVVVAKVGLEVDVVELIVDMEEGVVGVKVGLEVDLVCGADKER